MIDDKIRAALRSSADEIPDRRSIPPRVLRRTRIRVLGNTVIVGLTVAAVIAGATVTGLSLGDAPGDRMARPSDRRSAAAGTTEPIPTGKIAVSRAVGTGQDLFVIDVERRTVTTLTDDAALEDSPTWSPDGTSLAYQAYRGRSVTSGDAIFVLEHGSAPREVADVGEADAHPDWSPDGSLVAFDSTLDGPAIYVVEPDGSNLRRVTEGESPAWSPDSSRLAFIRDSTVHVTDVEGGHVEEVPGSDGAADVAWSPDGSLLAFSTYDGMRGDLYTIPATGGAATRLTDSVGPERSPEWSPDGRFIAAVEVVDGHAGIVVVATEGRDKVYLTPPDRDYFEPSWSPG